MSPHVQIIVQDEPIPDPLPVVPQLRLDEPSLGQRNLFAYRTHESPVVVTQPVVHPAPLLPSPPAGILETPASPAVPFPWRCIGTFGPIHNRVAALKRDGDVLTIRVGDRVGDFVLRAIGAESLTFEGPDGVRRIPLSTGL